MDKKQESTEVMKSAPLREKLEEFGLDGEYWVPHFQEYGIVSPTQAKYSTKDTFYNILKKKKHDYEVNAMREFFNSVGAKWAQDLDEKIMQERRKKLAENIKELEKKTHVKFDKEPVSPLLPESTEDLSKTVQQSSESGNAIERATISEGEIIKDLEQGMVSRGIFINNDMNDSAKQRKSLISDIEGLKILTYEHRTSEKSFEFNSKEQFLSFEKVVTDVGVSAAASVLAKGYGVEVGVSVKVTNENVHRNERHKSFAGREDVLVVPCCRISAEEMRFEFTEKAKERLFCLGKMLKENVNRELFRTACQQFFREFGSHLYCGVYTIGGIYRYSASCSSTQTASRDETRRMVNVAINALVQESRGGGKAGVDVKRSKTKIEQNIKSDFKVTKNILKIGGPQELDNKEEWKKELLRQNSTWAIIDRDSLDAVTYRGIWDLILDKSEQFADIDSLELAIQLQQIWEEDAPFKTDSTELPQAYYQGIKKIFLDNPTEESLTMLQKAVLSVAKHGSGSFCVDKFFKTEVENDSNLQKAFREMIKIGKPSPMKKLQLHTILAPLKQVDALNDMKFLFPPQQVYENPYSFVTFYPF